MVKKEQSAAVASISLYSPSPSSYAKASPSSTAETAPKVSDWVLLFIPLGHEGAAASLGGLVFKLAMSGLQILSSEAACKIRSCNHGQDGNIGGCVSDGH